MICPVCNGSCVNLNTPNVPSRPTDEYTASYACYEGPCSACHGFGIIHCCEGEQEQPVHTPHRLQPPHFPLKKHEET